MIVEAILEYILFLRIWIYYFFILMLSLRAESLDWYLGQGRAALYFLSRKLSLKGIFPPKMLESC